jgi:cell division protein FtsB
MFVFLVPGADLCEGFRRVARFFLLVERVLPIAILVMAVVGAPALILAPEGLPRLRSLSKELLHVQNENAELRQQIRHLRGRVQHLREDPAAVERIARDELGLVRTSEVVFQFPRR